MGNCICGEAQDNARCDNNNNARKNTHHNNPEHRKKHVRWADEADKIKEQLAVLNAPSQVNTTPNWRRQDPARVETMCEIQARHRTEPAKQWQLPNGGLRIETACEKEARQRRELGGGKWRKVHR